MEAVQEAQRASSALPDDVRLLGDAVKSLVDANNTTSLTVLAKRLAPFRIDLKETMVGETLSVQPVLVFEDGYNACPVASSYSNSSGDEAQSDLAAQYSSSSNASNTAHTESTMTEMDFSMMPLQGFMDNGILSQCAEHVCPSSGGGLDGDLAFGVEITQKQNEGLYNTLDLFPDNKLFNASNWNCQLAIDFSIVAAQSAPRSHVSNDAAMLNHTILSYQKDGDPDPPLPVTESATAVNPPKTLMTSAAVIECPGPFRRDTTHMQSSPSPVAGGKHEVDGRDGKQDKNGKPSPFLADVTLCKIDSMVQTCLRPDYLQFLKTNLPRWVRDGLWHNDWSQGGDGVGNQSGRFENLQRVYSCFCQLDARIKGDAIRGRMVMVLLHLEFENMYHDWKCGKVELAEPMTSMGRGNISAVIDNILEKAHPEWLFADSKQKADFRAKFHNRKRHGKRWWMLMDALGPSVLLLCSSRFAGAMKNTTVTASMIQALPPAIQKSQPKITQVLNVINPIAKSLFHDRGYETYSVDELLTQLKALEPSMN
ncbi:hypothetical protein E4U55_004630 [Claviceps digitariae]|nr:hypothetical protein E4U55_004630 [Claviceps digitariae]